MIMKQSTQGVADDAVQFGEGVLIKSQRDLEFLWSVLESAQARAAKLSPAERKEARLLVKNVALDPAGVQQLVKDGFRFFPAVGCEAHTDVSGSGFMVTRFQDEVQPQPLVA